MLYTGKPPLKEPFSALYFSDEKQSAGGKRSKKPREKQYLFKLSLPYIYDTMDTDSLIMIAIMMLLLASAVSSIYSKDPLDTLNREEYRYLYSQCSLKIKCITLLGPTAQSMCVTSCMRDSLNKTQ